MPLATVGCCLHWYWVESLRGNYYNENFLENLMIEKLLGIDSNRDLPRHYEDGSTSWNILGSINLLVFVSNQKVSDLKQ